MTTYLFKHTSGKEHVIQEAKLVANLLAIFGGGYTIKQTTDAMVALSSVKDGKTIKHKGWTVTKEEEHETHR